MKIRTVALLSLTGMLLSSAVGWSFGLPALARANPNVAPSVPEQTVGDVGTDDPTLASFETGTTLRLGGRGTATVVLRVPNDLERQRGSLSGAATLSINR